MRLWNSVNTSMAQKHPKITVSWLFPTEIAELLLGKQRKSNVKGTWKRPTVFFLELIAMGRVCFSPWLVTQTLLQLCLSWVLSVRLVNEPSSPAYVHSCPDVASGSAEAVSWWLGPFCSLTKGSGQAWEGGFWIVTRHNPPSPLSIRAPQEMGTGTDTRPNQIPCPNNGQTQ